MHMLLTFDIGGTHIRAARYHLNDEKIIDERKILSPNYINSGGDPFSAFKKLCHNLRHLGDVLFPDKLPEAIAIAFPAPINGDGVILAAPTLFGNILPVQDMQTSLSQTFWESVPTFILNDVTAAGYRYLKEDKQDFCIITVSSGIGNKIFIDGKPLLGINGCGGEVGHFQIDDSLNALLCDCGGRGHLGAIASGRGTLALAKTMAKQNTSYFNTSSLCKVLPNNNIDLLSATLLVEAFHIDDPWTKTIIQKGAAYLGKMIALVHLSTGIERFIIIGGFAKALGEPYRQFLIEQASLSSWNIGQDWKNTIYIGYPDDNDGLIGAAIYAAGRILSAPSS